ncbi:MAG: Hsp20/alpha crystallin family protein [Bacteroidales bacterium]
MLPAKKGHQGWLPDVFNDFFENEWLAKAAPSMPAVNIKETPKEFSVELAAPGLTKDDYNVSINDDNQLVILVKKEEKKEEKDEQGKYLRREFAYTQFQKMLILPDNIERDKIEAKAENGVLTVTLPKKESLPPVGKKQIEVK